MKENLSDEDIEQLRRNFMADDHSIWYNKAISNQEHGNKTEDNAGEQEEEIEITELVPGDIVYLAAGDMFR
mgnify:CR=1 FL=1